MLALSTLSLGRGAAAIATAAALTVTIAPASQARPVWDTSPVVTHHQVAPQPKIVNLRVGEHEHFDRVVVDIDGKLPGYRVQYVKRLIDGASGERVPLKGRTFIAITLTPARAHAGPRGTSVYEGPHLKQYRFTTLRGAAFLEDFEGVVGLGISLRYRTDFRVDVERGPNRLVIDLRH